MIQKVVSCPQPRWSLIRLPLCGRVNSLFISCGLLAWLETGNSQCGRLCGNLKVNKLINSITSSLFGCNFFCLIMSLLEQGRKLKPTHHPVALNKGTPGLFFSSVSHRSSPPSCLSCKWRRDVAREPHANPYINTRGDRQEAAHDGTK